MAGLDDFLNDLREGDQSEDRTVYIRETKHGPRIDFEIVDKTNFASAYPETVKEFRSKSPLSCGHQVDKSNPFGGYCQAKRRVGLFRDEICGNEYCALHCATKCPRCGISVGPCCAASLEGVFYCKACKRSLKTKARLNALMLFLITPFISPGQPDD